MRGARLPKGSRIGMTRTVTLRLGQEVYEEFREVAAAEGRTLPNLIETAALAWIREPQFFDDAEMTEILSNDALVGSLKTGSQQARRRIGDFVPD